MRLRYGRLLAALTAAAVLVTAMPVTAAQDTSGIMEEAGNDRRTDSKGWITGTF